MNMGYSPALAALLCLTTWITSLHTANGQPSNCCTRNRNTIISQENIVGYRIQIKGFCRITSVAFLTKRNKWICWDPQEPFAQKAMRRVDQISQAEHEKEVTTTPVTATDVGQTTAQLSISNSTQIQTEDHEVTVRTTDKGGKKKLKRGRKGRKRNRTKMEKIINQH